MSGDVTLSEAETALEPAWLRSLVREIPDFPQPGVAFRDITPLLGNAAAFRRAIDELAGPFVDAGVDRVSASSHEVSSSPRPSPTASTPPSCPCARPASCRGRSSARSTNWSTARTSWRSTATRFIPTSASSSSTTCWRRGTAAATARLVEALGGQVVGIAILIEIVALGGRAALGDRRLETLASYY